LKRVDLFPYRNQFSQLFHSQVLQLCHSVAQGALPPRGCQDRMPPGLGIAPDQTRAKEQVSTGCQRIPDQSSYPPKAGSMFSGSN
jgi:hypothetical protein